ncbi:MULTISPECIES: hypothetical protein [unclassified Streptomyces]|uniref:hypothetical protein n=1 Tax=unclassified Streptomyces TaxID=2593676 RepID=UPI00278C7B05|nr:MULTISPECIES: hypothetical protein [unclassified Streptomyces]
MSARSRIALATAAAVLGTGLAAASADQATASPHAGSTGSVDATARWHVKTLHSPRDLTADVGKTWHKDGRGGYNGHLKWAGAWGHPSVQMRVNWESGRRTQKKMKFGKTYVYRGAWSVYMRACDSTGCGKWW